MNLSLLEALSWRLLTETVRKSPKRLRIYEMHPGDGQYDCLALYTVEQDSLAYLNRVGSFTPFATLRDEGVGPVSAEPWKIWDELQYDSKPQKLVDELCQRIGLKPPQKLPPTTPPALIYRLIAELVSWTVGRPQLWECRSGYLDSSGWDGCGIRDEFFAPFEQARQRLEVREQNDFLDNPAYRFWFLLRDGEPMLCLETTGTVWNRHGESLEAFLAYQKEKRLWPLIMRIAGDLFP